MESKNVLILLSGGLDSTACLNFYSELSYSVQCLFIDFGQFAKVNEFKSVKRICKFYKVPFSKIKVSGYRPMSKGFIRGRNLFLLSIAVMTNPWKSGLISIGIHKGTNYSDCSMEFIDTVQKTVDIYENGKVAISAPFGSWTKNDIWEYCKKKNVPIEYTYSCELGLKQPCGKCLSCQDLKKLHAR